MNRKLSSKFLVSVIRCDAEPEPPGIAIYSAILKPKPIFWTLGAKHKSLLS